MIEEIKSRNHNEIMTPYEIINCESSLLTSEKDSQYLDHFVFHTLNELESAIYNKKYLDGDKEDFRKQTILNILKHIFKNQKYKMENSQEINSQFYGFYSNLLAKKKNLRLYLDIYQKELENTFRQKPINISEFPCFNLITEDSSQEEKDNQKDQDILLSILDHSSSQEGTQNSQIILTQKDLHQIYDI